MHIHTSRIWSDSSLLISNSSLSVSIQFCASPAVPLLGSSFTLETEQKDFNTSPTAEIKNSDSLIHNTDEEAQD